MRFDKSETVSHSIAHAQVDDLCGFALESLVILFRSEAPFWICRGHAQCSPLYKFTIPKHLSTLCISQYSVTAPDSHNDKGAIVIHNFEEALESNPIALEINVAEDNILNTGKCPSLSSL